MVKREPIMQGVRDIVGRGLTQYEVGVMDAAIDVAEGVIVVTAPKDRFADSLVHVLVHEGGYVNHPRDPGGATNKGVIQSTYDSWRTRQGLAKQSVRNISEAEIAEIYRQDYWDKVKGDDLPAGVDFAVFDFAVNSGVSRASRYLQAVIGAPQDGIIGPATLAAVMDKRPEAIINDLCDKRMAFLRSLSTFATFGKGWTRRVKETREIALGVVR